MPEWKAKMNAELLYVPTKSDSKAVIVQRTGPFMTLRVLGAGVFV